jgi:hypothetical protein
MHEHAERAGGAPHGRASYEVADVVRLCGQTFARTHALSFEQARVLRDVEVCRTPVLGGHLDVCEACGHSRPSYNSCRNRHCPKCQALRQARWVAERERRVLPTHHFHVVFTLPEPLRAMALRQRRRMFELLFACAAETLLDLGYDRLGAELAVTAVLHTWARDLGWHPHVHCIVSGGGFDPQTERWVPTKKKFLFPVWVLSDVFRGKMLARLRTDVDAGLIDLGRADRAAFFDALYNTRWVVYAKRPFGDAQRVIRYLGRYTHRVGISNARLELVAPNGVRFRTKEGRNVTLAPTEFLRRFLLHVLPRGFTKIRHYGLLAAGNVHGRLERARALLSSRPPLAPPSAGSAPRTWCEILLALTGLDLTMCPVCHERAVVRRPLVSPAKPEDIDTS